MLATFLRDRYSSVDQCVGPYYPHVDNSLLHLCASIDLAMPPLLQQAVDTICLAHYAGKFQEPWMAYKAMHSRGLLFAMLRDAIRSYSPRQPLRSRGPNSPPSNAQAIVISMILTTIIPPLPDDRQYTPQDSTIHLQGLLQFLARYGPTFLAGSPRMDTALIRHLQMKGVTVACARRRNFQFENAEWRQIPLVFHPREIATFMELGLVSLPKAESPQEEQPPSEAAEHSRTESSRNLIGDAGMLCPPFLEAVDNFCRGSQPHSQARLDDISSFVLKADQASGGVFTPIQKATNKDLVVLSEESDFDLKIEEHRHLSDTPKIMTEHYRFAAAEHNYLSLTMRSFVILMDCAILQVIVSGIERDGLAPDWTGVSMEEVERRSHAAALEICQHAYYISQRSTISAARCLRAYITVCRNFFESSGAEAEADWCNGCITATSARIDRFVSEGKAPSLCPIIETTETSAESCRYKRPNIVV